MKKKDEEGGKRIKIREAIERTMGDGKKEGGPRGRNVGGNVCGGSSISPLIRQILAFL